MQCCKRKRRDFDLISPGPPVLPFVGDTSRIVWISQYAAILTSSVHEACIVKTTCKLGPTCYDEFFVIQ